MNHWRAACEESPQARFGGGPTEQGHLRWYLAGGLPDSEGKRGAKRPLA